MNKREKDELLKQVLWELHNAQENLNFWLVKSFEHADRLERCAVNIRLKAEFVQDVPPNELPTGAYFPTRDQIVECGMEIKNYKNKVFEAERRLKMLRGN